jgi:hypothetical protein
LPLGWIPLNTRCLVSMQTILTDAPPMANHPCWHRWSQEAS